MRKIYFVLALLGLGGLLYAAAAPAPGVLTVMTATQILNSTPTYTNQMVICSNCVSVYNGLGTICMSTATVTARNSYILAGSSLTAVTACQ